MGGETPNARKKERRKKKERKKEERKKKERRKKEYTNFTNWGKGKPSLYLNKSLER